MQVQQIQSNKQTTFGTKIGKKLSKFIYYNGGAFSNENLRNIARIRNNHSLDTILELEQAAKDEQEKFNCIYKLDLHSDIIDRKSVIMRLGTAIYKAFQDFATGKQGGKRLVIDNRFPIPIPITKEKSELSAFIAKQFDDSNMLAEKIQDEIEQSKIANEEYKKFEIEYQNKMKQ